MELLILVCALAALGVAAQLFGSDSRPDPYPPARHSKVGDAPLGRG
jgi:hypothetical protein